MSGEPAAPVTPRPGRGIALVAAVVIGIAALAVIAVAIGGGRTATFPPDSPEAAFQGYLAALEAGDVDVAYGYFSENVQAGLTLQRYRSELGGWPLSIADARILIEGADVTGKRARLRLAIERIYPGGLGPSRSRETREIRLVREADGWRIDERLAGIEPAWW